MSLDQDRHQYFREIHKELGIPIAELEECYRSNVSEPVSHAESMAATANATAMFKEMLALGVTSSPIKADSELLSPSTLMSYYAVYKLIRRKREQVHAGQESKYGKIPMDQYMEIQNAYDEVVNAKTSGIGGKHALLIAALKRVNIQAMAWQESEAIAEDLLSRGYSQDPQE